jgi:hypothetical protein
MPGPLHVAVPPSPIDHVTDVGAAVAVTEMPGTDAVAEIGSQALTDHNQVGKFTSWSLAGLAAISGVGKRS